jgi:hypothetical protein
VTPPDPTRRRLLTGLGATLATAVAAGFSLVRRSSAAATPSIPVTSAAPTTPPTDAPPATTRPPTTTTTTLAPRTVRVICREAWRARPAKAGLEPHTVERLTLHHTAGLLDDNAGAPAQIRGDQRYHLDKGFPDLAYHFMVDLAGNAYRGRDLRYRGDTFTEYDPTGHLLVCCVGNFDDQDPPDAMLQTVADLFAWGAQTFSVPVDTLGGHRDYARTSCPGDRLYPKVAGGTLASMIFARLDREVVLDEICGAAATELVAAIEGA